MYLGTMINLLLTLGSTVMFLLHVQVSLTLILSLLLLEIFLNLLFLVIPFVFVMSMLYIFSLKLFAFVNLLYMKQLVMFVTLELPVLLVPFRKKCFYVEHVVPNSITCVLILFSQETIAIKALFMLFV